MRLKSELWIKAYLRLCQVNNVPAFVIRRGQADGGAIYIKVSRLNGVLDLYVPAPAGIDAGSGRLWSIGSAHSSITEQEADSYLQRQLEFDPDIWVVEIEDRNGHHFLGDSLVDF